LQPFFAHLTQQADVVLICGDLTDHGVPEEAQPLARELAASVKVPILAVLGNHDYHSGKECEVRQILTDHGIRVLAGDACELHGIGFAGVKGFAGGFGRRILEPWGEPLIKQLVHEAVEEALHLESALARLRTPHRIALLHYAPIRDTVDGEPPEIYPFLGSSRLEEPLNRYQVTMAFHGHAHHGKPEGHTMTGIPVYNVSMPLLRSTQPDQPPFRLLSVPAADQPAAATQACSPTPGPSANSSPAISPPRPAAHKSRPRDPASGNSPSTPGRSP
jgi:Icc-related predicted phosphoesterase